MEPLHAFPLADHWVVLRPAGDKLALLNSTAWDVLESTRQGLPVEEIGDAWTRRYGLAASEAANAARTALAQLREIGVLGPVNGIATLLKTELPRSRSTCAAHAPAPWALRLGLHPFTLRFATAELRDQLADLVRHLRTSEPSSGPRFEVLRDEPDYVLSCDGFELFRTPSFDALALALAYHSTKIAQRDESQLFVMHAGAVARNGRCVALAGQSGSGKSTLTAYLACHDYDYLADDMLPVDEATLLAEAAPGCIALKPPAWPVVATFRPDLDEFPILQGTQKQVRMLPPPVPSRSQVWQSRHDLAAIVFVEYARDRIAILDRISAPNALQALIDSQAYFARPLQPARMERLVRWIERLPAYRLQYGFLAEIPELLAPLLR